MDSLIVYRQAKATLNDYESFNHVELECFGENYYSYNEFVSVVSQGFTYIAEKDNTMIGFIICANSDLTCYINDDEYELIQTTLKNKSRNCNRPIKDKKYIHIFGFGVLPAYRRMGIGNILMNKIISCQKKYKQSIILEVRISNTNAIRLYKKFGFQTVITLPNYYEDNEHAYLFILPYKRVIILRE